MHFRRPLVVSMLGLVSFALAQSASDLPASCTDSCNSFEDAVTKCTSATDDEAALACLHFGRVWRKFELDRKPLGSIPELHRGGLQHDSGDVQHRPRHVHRFIVQPPDLVHVV
ncbi:hypothetical protein MNV49_001207 [Pseudohyphozyma bogoriensis]|nr:hypothetical protein MNV49_001207 [Pseudohyphozyma bogoriensis]